MSEAQMSRHSDIPEDIISAILYHIRYDRSTLRACAVTASIFLFPARRYLFSDVHISAGSRQCRNLHSLLSSSPHLAVHFRHFSVKDSQEDYDSDAGWITSESTLPLVLKSLPLLHSFYLSCIKPEDGPILGWKVLPNDLKSSIVYLIQLPTLRKVELRSLNFPISVFFNSPQIKHLHLPGCVIDGNTLPLEQPHLVKTRLEQLSITAETYSTGLLNILTRVFDVSQLRDLIILGPHAEMLKVAGELIKLSALSMERFQWSLPYFYNATGYITSNIPIDLSIASNLRVLELGVDFWYENRRRDPFPWLLDTLSGMAVSGSATNLENIIIGVTAEGFGDYELRSLVGYKVWEDLDATLTGSAYSKLRNVTIYLSALYTPGDVSMVWLAPMMKRLPLLRSRGLLDVTRYPFHQDMRGRGFSATEIQLN